MTTDDPAPLPDRMRADRQGKSMAAPWLSVAACSLLLAASAVAVFLAGGSPQGSLGIFLAGAGVALVLCRPAATVDWRLWAAGGGLILCASLAFLPARWFGIPRWREILETTPGIHLPSTVSLVPQESTFWLALLGVSILLGLFVLAHPLRSRALLVIATTAVLVCGSYAALAIYAKQTGWHYPFDGGATFGFLPNRNHTATFLLTGSILATGVLVMALREERWIAAILTAAGLSTCLVALCFFSASRGGIVFLAVGMSLWLGGLGRKHRSPRLIVSIFALVVAGGILFTVAGSEVRNRLLATVGLGSPAPAQSSLVDPAAKHPAAVLDPHEGPDISADFRLLIYRDVFRLIKDFPLTGTGLGTFVENFAQYRNASLGSAVALHPESDWLMLTAEAGIPALLCAVSVGWLLARRVSVWKEYPYWPLRWGCTAAAAAAVFHGLVDVPSHRVVLGWWILLLISLGLQFPSVRDNRNEARSHIQHAFFVLGGVVALAFGIQLIRAEWFGARPLPPFAAGKALAEIAAAYDRHDTQAALDKAYDAVQDCPLSAPLRYQYGVLLLHYENTETEADQAFCVQRLLNPDWPDVSVQQGLAWINLDPRRTASLWQDALARQRRIERATHAPSDNGLGLYRSFLTLAAPYPDAQRALASTAFQDPAHALAWLTAVAPEIASGSFGQFADQAELRQKFSEAERRQFLLLWHRKGNRETMRRFLGEHSDWATAAWPAHLQQLADTRQFETAVREIARRYHVSLDLPAQDAAAAAADPPLSSAGPLEVFDRYWRSGNTVAAARVLQESITAATAAAPAPPECWRLSAALAARDGAWDRAWPTLREYLRQTHSADELP